MANRRFIDFPIASTSGDTDIILIWQDGANKQTTKATFLSGLPENLDELNDVAISGLTNGQILRYDSVTGKWENTDQGNLDLNDLNDVSIVSPSNGQVLVYNSSTSKWENSSGGFVPYVGAVTTVDLGAQGLRAGYVRFDTSVVSVPDEQGLMYWDGSKSTVALIMNGTLQHIGQDTFFYCKNSTGSSIPKGTAVRFDGTDGASGHLKIAPFLANGTYPSTYFMGVTAEAIGNGSFGQVMHFGELDGINTSDFDAGDLLYASTTVAGGFQTTAPVAPNNIVLIAAAVNSKNNGAIIVRPTYGSNINTDEGVKITTPTTGQLLQLQAGGLWENKTIAQVLGGTSSQFVKGDGSLDSTAYGTGTVTSVGLSSATSGVTIGSSPVTTSGTITLAIATASGSQNGLLSSTDWTTFNSKQNALTNPVTGTGSSGQVAYFTGTSAISSESNLFWDATNDRLGIGTGIPTFQLDLAGGTTNNTRIRVQRGTDDTTQNLLLGWNGITVQRTSVPLSSPQTEFNIIQQGSDTSRTVFNISSNAEATFNGGKLSVNANSGSDSFGLFFGGTGTTLGGIKMGNATNTYGSLYFDNGSNDVTLFQQFTSGSLRFGTNSIVKMILTQNGRLLIGNAPPTESTFALDVNGTGRFSGAVTAAQYRITPNGTNAVYNIVNATNTYAGLYIMQAGEGSAAFGGAFIAYGHSHATKAGWTTAGISQGSAGRFSVNTQGTGEGTDIFTVDTSGNGVFNGSVTATSFIRSGGTSSQFLKADGSVDSTTYVSTGRTITINGTTQDLSADRTYNVGTITSVTASSPLFSSGGTTPNITIQQASGSQSGFLSSTDWTTFNSKVSSQWITTGSNIYYNTGIVIVGNTTNVGDGPLQVSGTATTYASFNSTNAGGSFIVLARNGVNIGAIGNSGNMGVGILDDFELTSQSGKNIHLRTSSGQLTVLSGGSVVIGTGVTPNGAKLQVDGSVTSTSLFVNAGTGSNLRVISGGTNVINVSNYNDASGFREVLLGGSELSFYTGTAGGGSLSEKMRINSAGNVGIGTDSVTTGKLVVKSGESNSTGIVLERQANTEKLVNIFSETADGKIAIASGTTRTIFLDSVGASYFTGGNLLVGTASQLQSTERLAVTSSSNAAIIAQFTGGSTSGWAAKFWNNATSGDNLLIEFATETSINGRGSVTYNRASGLTAFNTVSDYRLKTEIFDFNSLSIISNLKPKEFKIGNATRKSIGFIAHELQQYFPQAVTGIKDQIDNFGNPIYQSVDYSQLTALLTKAVQELKEEIDILKQKV